MNTKNSVFIATSLDGYIADKDGGIDWLHAIPNPDNNDMGYAEFIAGVDALVMGRTTYETVCGFGVDWPYEIPVFVLSNTLPKVADSHEGRVHLEGGPVPEVVARIHERGFHRLYIDGGNVIQGFLEADLIDELIVTVIPTLLGGGSPLFGELPAKLDFECVGSKVFLGSVVQNHFRRVR